MQAVRRGRDMGPSLHLHDSSLRLMMGLSECRPETVSELLDAYIGVGQHTGAATASAARATEMKVTFMMRKLLKSPVEYRGCERVR